MEKWYYIDKAEFCKERYEVLEDGKLLIITGISSLQRVRDKSERLRVIYMEEFLNPIQVSLDLGKIKTYKVDIDNSGISYFDLWCKIWLVEPFTCIEDLLIIEPVERLWRRLGRM